MVRLLVVLACVGLVGSVRADEERPSPALVHSAAHADDRERDGPAAQECLRRQLADILERQAQISAAIRNARDGW